ncbi:MAG TPA: hypothetical protein PLF13_00235 [candidate division Zixibacteria bacterium]|nr:hypothetical protein [candidate division Zixibacteria bacterium]
MKINSSLLTAIAIFGMALLIAPVGQAQTCNGSGGNFIDLDGDGFNDNAPDADGDGIPNGLDEDWIKNPQDGTGYKNAYKKGQLGQNSMQDPAKAQSMTKSQQFKRLQMFAGNILRNRISALGGMNGSGAGICDGSGSGSGAGTGICDGTGPHGGGQRNGNGGK